MIEFRSSATALPAAALPRRPAPSSATHPLQPEVNATNIETAPSPAPIPNRDPVGVPGPDTDSQRPAPFGFEGLAYSKPDGGQVPLLDDPKHPHFIAGGIGTPPEAGQLDQGGAANFLNPAWQEQVKLAAERNGGLGNAQDGYLAWSKEFGFVRLKHVGLSAEQNRRLAEISLQAGFPLEDLPSRTRDNGFEDPKVFEWVDEFIGHYDSQLQGFLADPVDDRLEVKSGKRRYVLEFNEKAQGFVSYEYKKHGGLRGFVQDNLKTFGPVLDVLSVVGHAIPGVGTAIALGSSALKTVASVIATGKLKAQQVVGAITNFILPNGLAGATSTQLGLVGAANVAAEVIDTGRLRPGSIVSAVSPFITGLPGGPSVDVAVRQGLAIAADAAETGKLDAARLFQTLAPVVFGLENGDTLLQFGTVAAQIANGNLRAGDVAQALGPLLGSVTNDPQLDRIVREGLALVASGIDRGEIDPFDFVRLAAPVFQQMAGELRGGRDLVSLLASIAETRHAG